MSRANIETLRRFEESFGRGQLERALELFDPAAEWQMAREDPDSTTHRGRQAIRKMWDGWLDSYPDLMLIAEDVIPAGDRVFVWATVRGRGAASDAAVEMHLAYVYTLQDSRITRVEEYFDRREGLAAAGLAPSD